MKFSTMFASLMFIICLQILDSEVIGIIVLTCAVFAGLAVFAKVLLNEVERREEERRNAEW